MPYVSASLVHRGRLQDKAHAELIDQHSAEEHHDCHRQRDEQGSIPVEMNAQ